MAFPYKISVIIPAFNYANYLCSAIESALGQSIDIEVIVVDDGSTDETAGLVKSYGARVRYHYQENQGPGVARNTGVDLAAGEYILFLDADDWLLPKGLVALADFVEAHPKVDVLLGGYRSKATDGSESKVKLVPLTKSNFTNFKGFIGRKFSISNGAVLIKHEVAKLHRHHPSLRVNEDLVFYGRLLATSNCASLPLGVVEVRAHPGRLRNNLDLMIESIPKVVDLLFDDTTLPADCMALKGRFAARRYLSLFRACANKGLAGDALRFYRMAVRNDPGTVFRFGYYPKLLRVLIGAV